MKFQRILVTGYTGYIGPWVVACLRKKFPSAHIFGASRCFQAPFVGAVPVDEALQLDLCNPPTIDALIEGTCPDAVVHLAGLRVGRLDEFLEVNVLGFERLLAQMHLHAPKARIIVMGSAAELGRADGRDTPISESVVCEPVDDYGVSKLAQSGIAQLHALRGQSIIRLRIFNLVGPNIPDSLLPGRCARLLRDTEDGTESAVLTFGSLSTFRDYVDVRDVARAAVLALEHGEVGTLYHIGSGIGRSGVELVEGLISVSGCTNVSFRAAALDGPASVPWQAADCRRARTELEWRPAIPWSTSLRDLWTSIRGSTPPVPM